MTTPKRENRRLEKIHIDSKLVTIKYSLEREDGERDNIVISSHEKPKKEFRDAMQALKAHASDILEVEEEWLVDSTVKAVSFKRKDGFLGASISVCRPIDMANSPVNFTTPLLFNDNKQHDGIGLYSDSMYDTLVDLIEHAYQYLDGNREPSEETGNMFEQAEDQQPHSNPTSPFIDDDDEYENQPEETPAEVGV